MPTGHRFISGKQHVERVTTRIAGLGANVHRLETIDEEREGKRRPVLVEEVNRIEPVELFRCVAGGCVPLSLAVDYASVFILSQTCGADFEM